MPTVSPPPVDITEALDIISSLSNQLMNLQALVGRHEQDIKKLQEFRDDLDQEQYCPDLTVRLEAVESHIILLSKSLPAKESKLESFDLAAIIEPLQERVEKLESTTASLSREVMEPRSSPKESPYACLPQPPRCPSDPGTGQVYDCKTTFCPIHGKRNESLAPTLDWVCAECGVALPSEASLNTHCC